MASIYDFSAKTIDGKQQKLDAYRGKMLLVVNVASKCGFTPQYEGLEALYRKFKGQGLVVLGFPCDQFGHQEPGDEAEIKNFCLLNYDVSFPMFSKIDVNGSDTHPLYKYLTSKETNPKFAGEIGWNFEKFLIGRDGAVIARFASDRDPATDEFKGAIRKALAQ